ncbi:hypothetical protein C0991_007788, partial [Blastosporella zonata]
MKGKRCAVADVEGGALKRQRQRRQEPREPTVADRYKLGQPQIHAYGVYTLACQSCRKNGRQCEWSSSTGIGCYYCCRVLKAKCSKMEDSLSPQGVGRVIMVPVGGVRPEDGEARAAVSDEESEKEGRAMEVDEVEHAPALTSKGKGKARAIEVDDKVDEAPAPKGKGKGKGKEPQGLPAEMKETAVKGRQGRAPAAPAAGPSQAHVIMPPLAARPSRLGPATTLPSTLGLWDQLREHAVELAGLNTVAYNCQGNLTNLESKVDRIQDALWHDIYFMQGMMEEYVARNVALEERVRYLEGLAGVEQEGEPSQK